MQIEGDSVQIKARGGAVRGSDRVPGGKAADKTPAKPKKGKAPARATARPARAGRYSSVVATRKGGPHLFAAYKDANGKVQEVRTGGTAAWRNNNPGNMMYDHIAEEHGAIGRNPMHDFAIFPDQQSGMDAIVGKLQSPSYQYDKSGNPMSIHDAIFRWAPPTDHNDSPAYVQAIRDR